MATVIARTSATSSPGRDVDAVGLPHAKPLLGDRRDGVAVALDLVLVVDDVAVRLHVVAVLDVDGEAVADPDQRLVDGRGGVASALDGDLVADGQLALLDPRDLVARGVLEHEGLAQAKGLAVDLVGPLALLVLDPEVVADRQQLLAHEKPLADLLVAAIAQEAHRPTRRPARGAGASPGPGEAGSAARPRGRRVSLASGDDHPGRGRKHPRHDDHGSQGGRMTTAVRPHARTAAAADHDWRSRGRPTSWSCSGSPATSPS